MACEAIISGKEGLSWKIALFLAIQIPHLTRRASALMLEFTREEIHTCQASSIEWPCHVQPRSRSKENYFHVLIVKGQINIMCDTDSLASLHREHHPGPTIYIFFILSQVGILLFIAQHKKS
jgi:hypothetical protein